MTMFNPGPNARPDGPVRYRTEPATGERVGILPATCKSGLHSLVGGRYLATVSGELLRVECVACHALGDPNYAWVLTLSGAPPVRAELDDRPYSDLALIVSRARRVDR